MANSFVQKLALINTIAPAFNPDMEVSYLKLMTDFLIVTCAQAQDSKNPNCIKDIKSLKILYPSGLGCAIDMGCLIKCVLSIIQLRSEKDCPSTEFKDLSFQCALILLNSQPESLQLPKENDTVEAIRIRIEVLKWLSSEHESKNQFFTNQNLTMIFSALKSNFDLGVLQVSHLVVKVYGLILKMKKRGEVPNLYIMDIHHKTKAMRQSLGAMSSKRSRTEPVLVDLDLCKMQLLRHVDQNSE